MTERNQDPMGVPTYHGLQADATCAPPTKYSTPNIGDAWSAAGRYCRRSAWKYSRFMVLEASSRVERCETPQMAAVPPQTHKPRGKTPRLSKAWGRQDRLSVDALVNLQGKKAQEGITEGRSHLQSLIAPAQCLLFLVFGAFQGGGSDASRGSMVW
jgi:hypothetical protein